MSPFKLGIALTTAVVSIFGVYKITMPAYKRRQRKEIEKQMEEFIKMKESRESNDLS